MILYSAHMSLSSCWRNDIKPSEFCWHSLMMVMSCYREGEFPGSDCPKCNEVLCPKPGGDCPQGLVPDICGCCPQGLCGLAEGEKCFNASLAGVLPPESRKFGGCGANLHCLLRPDLKPRVSDYREKRVVVQSLSVCGPRLTSYRYNIRVDFLSDDAWALTGNFWKLTVKSFNNKLLGYNS